MDDGVPVMGVLSRIDNRPRRARAGAARKRAAPSPWLSAGGKKTTRHVLKNSDAELFGSPLGAPRDGAPRFRVIAEFWVIPEHPTGFTDDDNATTTTRDTKLASSASARPVPRVLHVRDGYGGGLVLAVNRVAFVSCATPRGAETKNLNGSDAAAWWFVFRYL